MPDKTPITDRIKQTLDDLDLTAVDRLKQAVDDLGLEAKIAAAAEAGEDAVLRGVELAGGYVHQHRSDIDALLDRAYAFVDTHTDGRYADQAGRVRSQLTLGVARLAERRPATDDDGPRHLAGPEA